VRLAAPLRVVKCKKYLSFAPKVNIKITSFCFYNTLPRGEAWGEGIETSEDFDLLPTSSSTSSLKREL
jgi:hypothetical protein